VRIGKTNASEPLKTCRKRKVTSKPRGSRYLGISSGENLLTARAMSGMKVASVRFGRVHGTWEPVASMPREPSKRKTRKDLSTDARHRGGMARSSEEAGYRPGESALGAVGQARQRCSPNVLSGQLCAADFQIRLACKRCLLDVASCRRVLIPRGIRP
jgi:hypothetical protein